MACLPLLAACGGAGSAETPPPATSPGTDSSAASNGAEIDLTSDPRFADLYDAVERDPGDPAAFRALGIALHGERYHEAAVAPFERAVELDPTPRALLDLALGYSSAARLGDAERTYRRILEIEPGHAVALHNLGNLAYNQGRIDESITLYGRSIAAKPDYLLAHFHRADALRQAGRYEEAYRGYEHVLQLEPRTAVAMQAYDDALYRLASLDIKMGAHERAGRLLVELIRANPEHPAAHYALGQVLLTLGRTDEAQQAFATHQRILAARKPDGPAATGD